MVLRKKLLEEVRAFIGTDKFDFSADGIRHRYLPDFLVNGD